MRSNIAKRSKKPAARDAHRGSAIGKAQRDFLINCAQFVLPGSQVPKHAFTWTLCGALKNVWPGSIVINVSTGRLYTKNGICLHTIPRIVSYRGQRSRPRPLQSLSRWAGTFITSWTVSAHNLRHGLRLKTHGAAAPAEGRSRDQEHDVHAARTTGLPGSLPCPRLVDLLKGRKRAGVNGKTRWRHCSATSDMRLGIKDISL
ncbi:hypothetical protein RRG08_044294 [Elysia crispata]|uniref:Uncharacterized protein n=1 Tax=Elysia crispata TaxID=231223 RepID=A0AAE0XY45_9GAST|nr:hypothetical protein RRG08_044294 [Elysia crispata]